MAFDLLPLNLAPLGLALAWGGLSALGVWLIGRVGLGEWRREKGLAELPWTERARLTFPARAQAGSFRLVCLLLAPLGGHNVTGPLSLTTPLGNALIAFGASALGGTLAMRALLRKVDLPTARSGPRHLEAVFQLRAPVAAAAAILGALATLPAATELWQVGVSSLAAGLLSLFGTFPLLRVRRVLHQDPNLEHWLAPLFARTTIRPRKLEVLEVSLANAYAFPLTKGLMVTRGAIEVLSPAELEAIVAHELGHLAEGRRAWVRISPLLYVVAFVACLPWLSGSPWLVLPLAGLFFVSMRIRQRGARRLEEQADEKAHKFVDPATYARALEKLYERNAFPAVVRGNQVHPSLYDRLLAAGVTPTYPRPAPPVRGARWTTLSLGVVALGAALGVLLVDVPRNAADAQLLAAGILSPYGAEPASDLALRRFHEGDLPAASSLYQGLEKRSPKSPYYSMNLAFTLASQGRCSEAQAALARAWRKAPSDPRVLENLPKALTCDSP